MATDCNISAYKILVNRSIKITNQVTFNESTFPMKVQQPTRTLTPDDPIVTVDAFPPEEGTYLVSYDFDALDSEGF